jgi:carbamoyl-phosphate synthase large subunit
MKELNVIMTGAGAPGARGTEFALRAGAKRQGVKLRVIGIDRNPAVAAQGFCDAVYPVPATSSPDYGAALAKICSKEDVRVIVPQTTMEIEWLSGNKVPAAGVGVMVNSRAAIDLANSKTETARIFSELGLGVPRYFSTHSREEFLRACEDLGYPQEPVVVKIPVSNGMRGLRILKAKAWDYARFAGEKPSGTDCTLEDMLAIIETAPQWPELMVCEYLEGDEYSVDCYSGRSGEIAIPRKRDVIRTGISFVTTLKRDEEMIAASAAAARRMGLCGVYGFQFKMRNGVPKVLECNPRVQGTMIATLAAGNNIIWAAVTDLVPDLLEPVALNADWTGGRCYRYWGAVLEGGGTFTVV